MKLPRRTLLAGVAGVALLAADRAQAFLFSGAGSSGGGEITLTAATFINNSGSTQTNVPFQFGLPIAPANLPSGNVIQVLDSDGVTPLAIQQDEPRSDYASNVRHVTIRGVKPSLATGNSAVTIKSVVGTAASGTAITYSDITALCSSTFEPGKYTIVDGGTTYTASLRDLDGASTTWSLTAPTRYGSDITGPYCSRFAGSVPFKTGGGTAHPYARLVGHIYAHKIGSGAVTAQGGANPIVSIRVHAMMENGYAQQNGGNAAKDLPCSCLVEKSTSLTVGTLTTDVNWTNDSTGPGTLTIGAYQNYGINYALTRSTGTWTADDHGRVVAGTGGGLTGLGHILSPTVGGTTATIRVLTTFNQALASGNYTMYGVGNAFDTRWRRVINFGATIGFPESPDITFALWDGTGGTCTLRPYLRSTKMILNSSLTKVPISAITNTPGSIGNRPYAATANIGAGNFHYEQPAHWEQTGDHGYIGVFQACDIEPVIKFDANGQTRMFQNADARLWYQYHPRDINTGLTPTLNNGTDWTWAAGGTFMQSPSPTTALAFPAPYEYLETAHIPGPPYIPWLITGDLVWAEECHFHGFFFGWAGDNPGYAGSQLSRFPWSNTAEQQRNQGWQTRGGIQAWAATPDSGTGLFGIAKSQWATWLNNQWSYCVTTYVNDTTTYSVGGPRWTLPIWDNNTFYFSPWQVNYCLYTLHHAKEIGCLDTNGVSFKDWWQPSALVPYTDNNTNLASDWSTGVYYWLWRSVSTWADVYQYTATNPVLRNNVDYSPLVWPGNTVSASLSATGGAAVTVTFVGGNPFANGGSFYVGGFISIPNVAGGKITSVNAGAGTCVIDTTGFPSFSSTTIAASDLALPYPAPGDATARGTKTPFSTNGINNYIAYMNGAALLCQDDGAANSAAAATYYNGRLAATGSGYDSRFGIDAR